MLEGNITTSTNTMKNQHRSITNETRFKVIEYSLTTEDAINSLLLLNLGIYDKSSTKLFGQKAGITLKNKIDLLYDINVLSKEQHGDLELLMIIRNKFTHDIHCDTFLSVLEQLDKGIKNRFKIFLEEGGELTDEKSCAIACLNLYGKNIKAILENIKRRKDDVKNKSALLQILMNQNVRSIDMSIDLVVKIFKILESADLEDPKVAAIGSAISSKCVEHANRIKNDKKSKRLDKQFKLLFSTEMLKSIFK